MSTMNRMANSKNEFQGEDKRVLCVCSAGLLRSPTAAFVLQKEFGFNTRAAGLSKEYALIPVDDVLLHWADEVVVMETWMAHELANFDGALICLNIPDNYERMDPELQNLILSTYKNKTNETL
jgi:predicted protein tyrosine phosphatase